MLIELLKSLRPKQWYKNFVVFIGIIFSLNILNTNLWLNVFSAFIIFCLLSGGMYILNDIKDLKNDRVHPKKRKRPIVSGRLKVPYAFSFSVVLIILSLSWSYLINSAFFYTTVAFLLLNLAYSFWLKYKVIADVLAISLNFVLRANAGVVAIGVPISNWIILCALLLALFLALVKRRHEILLLKNYRQDHRRTLDGYSKEMLDQMISITAASLIASYSLFTFFSKSTYMMVTIPVVIYAVFRYMFLIHYRNMGGEPELTFKDRGMIISISLWIILSVVILYGLPIYLTNLLI